MEAIGLVAFGRRMLLSTAVGLVLLAWPAVASAAFGDQTKLTAIDPSVGTSVALSADGDTALVDNADSAEVYTRASQSWSLQARLTAPAGTELGNARFGHSVALSADGDTAVLGGYSDNGSTGAAWVFTRSGSTWSEQSKLLAPTAGPDKEIGAAEFGWSVAISPDGDTVLAGGLDDNSNLGASWAFVRNGTTWSEQTQLTAPTVGPGAEVGSGEFGSSMALAVDTPEVAGSPGALLAVIGAFDDNGFTGAAWLFKRLGSTWSDEQRIVASNPVGPANFGTSVALTPDGSLALIGAVGDGAVLGTGAVWAFELSPGILFNQQAKIKAPTSGDAAAIGAPGFGGSVGISSDGSTAVIGGPLDNGQRGADWIATRSGATWAVTPKLVPPGSGADAAVGPSGFGLAVAISSDGLTVLAGGPVDDANKGAAWVFTNGPTISTLSPPSGPASGGTTVRISGTHLGRALSVSFGGVPAASFTVVSDSEVDAVTPPGDPAPVDVTVSTPGGTSPLTLSDRFTYFPSAPGAPTAVKAKAGNRSAAVSFTAPRSNGSAITSYRVVASSGGASATASASPITVTGLKNGTHYTFTVTATNGIGTGPPSTASNTVVPKAPSPKVSRLAITGVRRHRPKLVFTVTAANGAKPLKSIAVKAPKGLTFARRPHDGVSVSPRHAKFTLAVKHGVLTVTLKSAKPSVKVTAAAPALTSSKSLHGKVRLAFTIVDAGHARTRVTATAKVS
jgi:hypothetical protein